jgi:hypothetical protein
LIWIKCQIASSLAGEQLAGGAGVGIWDAVC